MANAVENNPQSRAILWSGVQESAGLHRAPKFIHRFPQNFHSQFKASSQPGDEKVAQEDNIWEEIYRKIGRAHV